MIESPSTPRPAARFRRFRPIDRRAWLCVVLLLVTGCRAHRGGEGAWQRFDLWTEEARVEGGAVGKALVRGSAYLGPFEVRPASRLAADPERRVDQLAAGEIAALRMAPGVRATWRVELGTEPYLSFVPMRDAGRGCDCRQRVEARVEGDAGAPVELYGAVPKPPEPFAPATIALDLRRFAGKTIALTLAVDLPSSATAASGKLIWGSPAIYSRAAPATAPDVSRHPNVLLIGIDTLRADALGAYGRTPSVTPALDRLAAESDVWLQAFSCFNVTNPSFASLLTGLYGKDHGVYDFETPLPPERVTLAEAFARVGYDTRAILSIDHLRNAQSGLGQGFQEFSEVREQRAGEASTDLALDWIAARRKPFFLWLHLFDPHTPHTPPEPFAGGLAPTRTSGLAPPAADAWKAFRPAGPVPYRNEVLGGAKELYAAEVAYTDRQIDRLLDFLRSRRLLERTIVVVIADHGENLEDHGVSYRHSGLWDTTTHVPLLIRWPGAPREGRRIDGLVQNVDVFPTLLAAAGLPVPPQDGTDLRVLTGGAPGASAGSGGGGRRAVFAEHTGQLGAMVRTARYLYMTSRGNRLIPDGVYLYDLERDPGEQANLAGSGLPAESDLDALLRRWLAARRTPIGALQKAQPLTAEEVARLRALGYQ